MPKGSGTRVRTVARSTKTGRFVKKTTAARRPSVARVESITVAEQPVELARSTATGRFVKKSTAKRHPSKTVVKKTKR